MFARYQISATTDHVRVAGEAKQLLRLNADGFFKSLLTLPSRRSLDLLRVAAGIYTVDRIRKRKKRRGNEDGIRQLELLFDVHDVGFWRQSEIRLLVLEILSFLTDDDWSFDFKQAQRAPGDSGHQDFLPLPQPFQPRHAALYSGGLDSAAGMANRLLEGKNDFLLVTVGHQSGLHHRVNEQLKRLRGLIQESQNVPVNILHSTLTVSLVGGKAKRMRQQERTQRSRAFLFSAAAVIAAEAYNLQVIEMFENGVGAINLPLMAGMLGGGLSTRGAHPTFLRLMSDLATRVTEKPMHFTLPFETRTKAEMLQALKNSAGLAMWARESRSCVHTSLREAGKTHCGRCPACIERRQAFECAGIKENLGVYQTDALIDALQGQSESDYLYLYRLEAGKWLGGEESVLWRMTNHLRLTDVPIEHDGKIRELQSRHAREVFHTFGSVVARRMKSIATHTSEKSATESGVIS